MRKISIIVKMKYNSVPGHSSVFRLAFIVVTALVIILDITYLCYEIFLVKNFDLNTGVE